MALLGTQALYEPANASEEAACWYSPGLYGTQAQFSERVNNLKQRFAPAGQKLLIVGAGWGHLVALCRTEGYDAWGCEASSYCVGKDVTGGFLLTGDALSDSSMRAVCASAGIGGGNPRFDLLVTEDMLPCLTNSEVTTALSVLRARCRTNLLHIVSCLRPDWWTGADDAERRAKDLATRRATFNWKTLAEWRAICTPPDVVIDAQGLA